MSANWKLKCPSCGELMGDCIPYKTLGDLSRPGAARFEDVPIAGHKYHCDCGCAVDVPTDRI